MVFINVVVSPGKVSVDRPVCVSPSCCSVILRCSGLSYVNCMAYIKFRCWGQVLQYRRREGVLAIPMISAANSGIS